MILSLIEKAAAYSVGKQHSTKSLGWFASKPSKRLGALLLVGVRISSNVLSLFFLLALGAL
jgi:hypothetical protein